MHVPVKRGLLFAAILLVAIPVRADEIRLKDGKKLYGVIVAYEDNMFKVKTDFGYVLVEKDKIAAIIPSTPATPKKESEPAKAHPAKPQPAAAEPVSSPAGPVANSVKSADAANREKPAPKVTNATVRPEIPPAARDVIATAHNIKSSPSAGTNTMAANAAPPSPPKEPEPPPNREEVQGNTYTNFTHGFRMYKAPGWDLIEGARKALPNAIVAMGTPDESTLLVIGEDTTKAPLAKAAPAVEERLRDIYENYRLLSQRKTTIAGLPAMEYKYAGNANDHDWSGTLAVIARQNDTLTILGMTYAQTDLIQIQENVIARAISSLDFNVH
jgi:hypothetical protein